MDSATIITPPATHAILPTGGDFEFEADALLFPSYDEAMEEALDWVEWVAAPVRIYTKRNGEWVPTKDVCDD
jgi:hypothetical protein